MGGRGRVHLTWEKQRRMVVEMYEMANRKDSGRHLQNRKVKRYE